MSRLKTIESRFAWNRHAEYSTCSGINCPDAAGKILNLEILWECNDCAVVSDERLNNWVKELNQCLD